MPQTGADALQGKKEYIHGFHTLTVTTQTKVYADGMMVSIVRAGESNAEKTAKSTGEEGWSVKRGDEVRVYNVDIKFE